MALVPFEMMATFPVGPAVPWASHFWETNVRTYVRGPDGRTGVWFLSLDASRFGAVAAARLAYSLPYFWSRMRLVETEPTRDPVRHRATLAQAARAVRGPGAHRAGVRARRS